MSSLTDTDYDEIFSLAINRAMTGGVPSPVTQLDAGNSDMEDEIEVTTTVIIMVIPAVFIMVTTAVIIMVTTAAFIMVTTAAFITN
jgi:hypothetical protein